MRTTRTMAGAALAALALTGAAAASEFRVRGYVEPELQAFAESGSQAEQRRWNASVAAEVSFESFWDNSNQWVVVKPFARWDLRDGNRSHADLREAKYARAIDNWEFRIGIDKVFWGVTEAVHLVDIVNQTDLVESIDGEEKLGQPMVMVSTVQDFGTFTGYLLPFFRERTFPSRSGRPAFDLTVDETQTQYESGAKQNHLDFALRYANAFDIWDVGLTYFQGTNRAPLLTPGLDAGGNLVLIPYYAQARRAGTDIQATSGAWLYKFEGFWQEQLGEQHLQATGGIEYSFYGIFDTPSDIGLVAEYVWDDRGANLQNPFANDAFLALRWTPNDAASTAVLAGVTADLDTQALGFSFEAERRFGADFFVSLEGRFFANVPRADPLYSVSDDSFLQLRIARYF
ncbi:hypothetical protein [uncultured Parvibaculum sp.]|mgnify:CR=1 FL=1|uniref:hypothetical protein n=1 Tax=uncultured Parvibaculum sp. TaxID=291828 RepID=UPI0030DD711E